MPGEMAAASGCGGTRDGSSFNVGYLRQTERAYLDTIRHIGLHYDDTPWRKGWICISSLGSMTTTMLFSQQPPFVPEGMEAMTVRIDLAPGDPGSPPHRHSG